jgi:NAD(P)-dependent dehydrogenase (short-subunit alcohol dehydrogenase family)
MSRIVAITGSASGIGAATRKRLEDEGTRVVGVDLRDAEVEADLSRPEGRRAAASAVLERAEGRLDGAVLCAGVGGHVADLGLVASVNYFGAVEVLDALLPALGRGEGPAAVVIASNSAQFFPLDEHPYVAALLAGDEARARELVVKENGFVAYAGSKHALARAVRRRAGAWGRAGVRLNALAPGPVRTPLLQATVDHPVFGKGLEQLDVPLGRFAEPAEIAALAGFLLGPEASFVHGSVVYVDGGNDAVIRPDRF